MLDFRLECGECGARFAPDMTRLACGECGAPLDVAYDSDVAALDVVPMPLRYPESAVSLGEGGTPSVRLPAIAKRLGMGALYAKLEFMNPTGSFKDRGTAVMMSAAVEMGASEVVEDSSGNAGASVAAYAARAGVRAHIFAPAGAPAAKLGQIAVYGARAHLVEGNRQDVTDAAVEFARESGFVYASHNLSPYFLEGTKTFAYEVAREFGGELLQHIVMPVGNGSLLIGAHKGFGELQRAGVIDKLPRLHAVQARAVMPLAAAFGGDDGAGDGNGGGAIATTTTIAGGIAVANPPRLGQALRALGDTGGSAVAVSDGQIRRWHALLAREEGVFGEPTSAAAFAGLEALVARGAIGAGESVLLPVTGFGLKDAFPE